MVSDKNNEKGKTIKQAAKELFIQFGCNKTSMDDIARRCGLAKPSLYYYYSNKEAIFNEIVVDEAGLFIDSVEKKLPAQMPADEKIALFFRLVYQDLKEYAAKMENAPEILYDHSPHGKPIVDQINQMVAEKLSPLLKAGVEEGIFDFDDERPVTAALVFMTSFLNLKWMNRFEERMRDRVIENMIDIILMGLKRRS